MILRRPAGQGKPNKKNMKPSLGRTVLYRPTETEKRDLIDNAHPGALIPKQENSVVVGIIIWCESNEENAAVNLLIMGETGGPSVVYSVTQGSDIGQWFEPPRV